MKKLLALALLLSATAFADTTGSFSGPVPACAGAVVCTGVGTSTFTWGTGDPSILSFTGNPGSITPGSSYSLGTLGFYNGVINSGSGVDQITLSITTNYNNATNSVLPLVITIVNTPNLGVDPAADADYISFAGLGNFHVFEQQRATIHLFINENGGVSVGDPSEGGFVTPEPASIALLGTGLLGAAGSMRRKFLTR